jgi:hypothetical protein
LISKGHSNAFPTFFAFKKKEDLYEVAEGMLEVGECPGEIIICLLEVLKHDFGEADEAMFHGVERPCEVIFFILDIEKINFDEVN